MSYTSISPNTVSLFHDTQTLTWAHTRMHKHFAPLSSCHPPATSTGKKQYSALGNKLIHVSRINSGSEQKASDSTAALLPGAFMKTCCGKKNFNAASNESL